MEPEITPTPAPILLLEIADTSYPPHPRAYSDIRDILKSWAHRDICTCVSDYLQYGAIPTSIISVDLSPYMKNDENIYNIIVFEQFTVILYADNDGITTSYGYYYNQRHIYTGTDIMDIIYLSGRNSLCIIEYNLDLSNDFDGITILTSDGTTIAVTILKDVWELSTIRELPGVKYSIVNTRITEWLYILCNDVLYRCAIDTTCMVVPGYTLYPDVYLEENVPSKLIIVTGDPHTVRASSITTDAHEVLSRISDGDVLYANVLRSVIHNKYNQFASPHIRIFDENMPYSTSAERTRTIDIFPFHGGYITRTIVKSQLTPEDTTEPPVTSKETFAYANVFCRSYRIRYLLKWINDMPDLQYAGRCGNKFYFADMGKLYTWL